MSFIRQIKAILQFDRSNQNPANSIFFLLAGFTFGHNLIEK